VTTGTIDPMDDGTPIGPPWGNPHDRLDEIRRRTHVALAARVAAALPLLEVPRGNIHRWAGQAGYMQTAHAEWLEILEKPWPEVRRLMVATDENSTRLRQSSPFTGIPSPWERKAIHEAVPT